MRTDKEILEAVQKHHDSVVDYMGRRNADVLMTVLVGSQNYDLACDTSDIDTFSFVLPSIFDISTLKDPIATEYELDDGKCCIKDMRTALNLLMKTNPNSVEWFCSDYIIYNPTYMRILKKYLSNKQRKVFLYCDVVQMANSCKGMIRQLKNRNMPAGKKYSHTLRVVDMWNAYVLGDTDNILKLSDVNKLIAREAKHCTDESKNEEYQIKSEQISEAIEYSFKTIFGETISQNILMKQKENKEYVYGLQELLLMKHLALQIANKFG